ncbi:HEAT repeat domain-containing protein [Clostridium sp. CF012]|uniref:HEAT repeat domain-containing protein n=1 Tax=Clostridium sp. CF012 TaxID=2843319 RepID=UPI001C0C584C|nr:HEAT repeat domain-containing protein [Clostridium sp. CF012]MBU3143805.1 HEAT repeat domain-containing protein [Clostridium sp. CF012]
MIKKILQKIINLNIIRVLEENNTTTSQSNSRIQTNRLLEFIRDNRELSAIPDVFQLLLSKNAEIKLQSAKSLHAIMRTLNSTQLIKVDKIFRARGSYDWNYNLENKEPKELLHHLLSEEEKVTILGLCSFHPNGYFREKAIINLSQLEKGYAIPYLLIRVNDWVREVKNVSKKYLLSNLNPGNAMNLVNNLPLVLRLGDCCRDEHDDIINSVVSMLSSPECSSKLISGVLSIDSKVRLSCYKIILETRILDNKNIIDYLIKDPNSYIRLFVLRNIQRKIALEEFIIISQLLLNDRCSQIRILALETIYEFNRQDAVAILINSLFDRNNSVRELSRYLLMKDKKYDFASLYRDAIQKNEKVYSSICGLGETGNINDTKNIAEFMDSNSVKIVKASINTLARLDFAGYKEKFILILNDCRPGISKSARRVLYKELDSSDADIIYNIFKRTIYDHAKTNSCFLLCSLSKWYAISYIIEFCADKNETIATLGQYSLENWKLKFNRSFTTPTKNQVLAIRKSLIIFGTSIKDSDRKFIEFSIRNF